MSGVVGSGRAGVWRWAARLADARWALCLCLVVASAYACVDVLQDPDVWWHIKLGEWILANHRVPTEELFSYTATGNPLTAHEWLPDVLFALVNRAAGLLGVSMLAALVSWSGLVALAIRARDRGAGPMVMGLGVALAAKAAEPVLGTRPQVATFALSCWVLLVSERALARGGRWPWLLPPLFLLWANLHAGFVGGVGLVTLVVIAEVVKPRLGLTAAPSGHLRRLSVGLGLSVVAACFNPAGPGLYRFALFVSATESRKPIVEWQSPNFHDAGLTALLILVVGLIALAGSGKPLPLTDALLSAAGIGLALLAVRNTGVAVATVAPLWMTAAGDVGGRLLHARSRPARGLRRPPPGRLALGAIVVGVGAGVVGVRVAAAAEEASPAGVARVYPHCATMALQDLPGSHRVLGSYEVGGYLVYELWPTSRPFIYGESISLGDQVAEQYLRLVRGAKDEPTALSILDSTETDAVVMPAGPLTDLLATSTSWEAIGTDHNYQVWLRKTSATGQPLSPFRC